MQPLEINEAGRRCIICYVHTTAGPFCRQHWYEYKDQLHEPWVRGLATLTQREERAAAQAQARIVSLEHIQERIEQRETEEGG